MPHLTWRNERGVALVVALLVLLVLSLLCVVLMMSVSVGTKIAGHNVRESQALYIAEAGVSEAIARIRNSEGPDPAGSARQVVQVFLTGAGSVPALGTDSTGLYTRQPGGQWLTYSTAARGPNVLTVEFRTDSARTTIYRYDSAKNPPVNTTTGFPIYRITSTGVVGADLRRIVSEVIQKPVTVNAKGAIVANVGIDFSGNSDVCGYNHSADTPAGTKGRGGGVGNCDENNAIQHWELGYGDLAGSWSTGSITSGGSSSQNGNPPRSPGQAGFYAGPWEAFSMGQSDFFSWVGAPTSNPPADPRGIIYVDNNSTTQDQSATCAYHGGDGEGLLYVDGDMTINGDFTYRGMIYIEGDLKINGTCWILGGLIVRGKTTIKIANGNGTILYSNDAIQQNVSRYGGQLVTLSWREGL
ncbi:MAG: hypothetical protein HZC42_06225 [Candidatus Eisenbacteria bacterium]|nr:hypothetical protein [Candidatus Eisenbacteria bacterium]